MTDVRERIARVLHASDVDGADLPFESVSGTYGLMVDALLEAFPWLADEPSDTEVEAGARALNAEGWTCYQGADEPGNYDDCEDCRRVCAGPARAVLVAAREARTT